MADTPWNSVDPFAGGLTKDMEFIVKVGDKNYRIPLSNITLSEVDTSDAKKLLPLNSVAVLAVLNEKYSISYDIQVDLNSLFNKNGIYVGTVSYFDNYPSDVRNFAAEQGVACHLQVDAFGYRSYCFQTLKVMGFYNGTWEVKTYKRIHVDSLWFGWTEGHL